MIDSVGERLHHVVEVELLVAVAVGHSRITGEVAHVESTVAVHIARVGEFGCVELEGGREHGISGVEARSQHRDGDARVAAGDAERAIDAHAHTCITLARRQLVPTDGREREQRPLRGPVRFVGPVLGVREGFATRIGRQRPRSQHQREQPVHAAHPTRAGYLRAR
ncbi:MAG: hypothetical protein QM817_03820 [Archangium sp.]